MRIPDGELLLRIAFLDLPLMAIFFSYNGAQPADASSASSPRRKWPTA